MRLLAAAALLAAAITNVKAQFGPATSRSYASPTEVSFPGYCYSYFTPNCLNFPPGAIGGPTYTGVQGPTVAPSGATRSSIAAAGNYIFDPSNCAAFCGSQSYYELAMGIYSNTAC
jgi:hypothetical protein